MHTDNRISQIYNPLWKGQDKAKMEKNSPHKWTFHQSICDGKNLRSKEIKITGNHSWVSQYLTWFFSYL